MKRRGSVLPVRPHVDEPKPQPSSLKSQLEETNKQVERLQQAFGKWESTRRDAVSGDRWHEI
jgi:hypothetical protein